MPRKLHRYIKAGGPLYPTKVLTQGLVEVREGYRTLALLKPGAALALEDMSGDEGALARFDYVGYPGSEVEVIENDLGLEISSRHVTRDQHLEWCRILTFPGQHRLLRVLEHLVDDQGRASLPAALLGRACGYSGKWTYRLLDELEKEGRLVRQGPRRGGAIREIQLSAALVRGA